VDFLFGFELKANEQTGRSPNRFKVRKNDGRS